MEGILRMVLCGGGVISDWPIINQQVERCSGFGWRERKEKKNKIK